jgi:uncharacterized protein (TIGR03435 family)
MRNLVCPLPLALSAAVAQTPEPPTLQELSIGPCDKNPPTRQSLAFVLSLAYGVREYLIEGPDSIRTECVNLTIPTGAQGRSYRPDESQPVLQRQLAEVFHLQAHKEFKDRDVFILKLPDDGTAFKLEPKAPGTRGDSYSSSLTFPGFKISVLAQILTTVLQRPVIDETALDSTFDIELKWGFHAEIPKSVKDQLGLEMVEAKRPIETLVIDRIDKWPDSK